jgi:molybdopterin-containing oxidoreductase family iron-sulfur binding subunit
MADHRWPVRADEIEAAARDLAAALGILPREASERPRFDWISVVARDLKRYGAESLVLTGSGQTPAVHALVAAINHALGSIGRTVEYIDPPAFRPVDGRDALAELTSDMDAGKVDVLLLLGGNPVYSAPADLEFHRALSRVKFRAHLGLYEDETSWLCHWHLPEAHFLESWGDAVAFDGTASIVQPVIAPLYDGRTSHDVISVAAGEPGRKPYDLVRDYWRRRRGGQGFEMLWQTALHDGIVTGTARAPRKIDPRPEDLRRALRPSQAADSLEIVFKPDPTVWDGRYANNPWLQELPKPLTTLTWDNAAMIAPSFARRRGIANGDLLAISREGRTVRAPAWIVPGHADESITLHLGYGRMRVGRVGNGRGFNAFLLRTRDAFGFAAGFRVEKTGEKVRLAATQTHHSMEGRDPVRVTTADRMATDSEAIRTEEDRDRRSLYPEVAPGEYAWGMVIDLNTCTGCQACVLACQVENNVPVVGKDEVLRGREMHWLRVDTYQTGPPDRPDRVHQPVPCMHCEKAPCEIVCPTVATAHSSEGLNQMVYNRCVGTRYCQNNCPYKVRRFNFFGYADFETPQRQQSYNPDVTVRERGVMEKCTYCVQRIVQTRIGAEKEGRKIRDGEVQTACQQVCPNGAIVFGDLGRRDSQVAQLRSSPLNYELLGELNTRPRTTYLARIRNPNPELGT